MKVTALKFPFLGLLTLFLSEKGKKEIAFTEVRKSPTAPLKSQPREPPLGNCERE